MKTTILVLIACASVMGETNIVIPKLEVGDRIFTNATIRKVNASTVVVRDGRGFGSVQITNLPSPYRERFLNTNDLKREAEESKEAKSKSDRARQEAFDLRNETARRKAEVAKQKSILVRVDSVRPEGFLGTVLVVYEIRANAPDTMTSNQRAGAQVFAPPRKGRLIRTEKEERQKVFVSHGPRDVADGKEVIIKGWMIGTKAIDGVTVEAWDCLPSWQRNSTP